MKIDFSRADLRPLIAMVVHEAMAEVERRWPGDRLAYPEAEAAALLGLRPHVLRDARLRGEIVGTRAGSGKKVLYERAELMAFLARNRTS